MVDPPLRYAATTGSSTTIRSSAMTDGPSAARTTSSFAQFSKDIHRDTLSAEDPPLFATPEDFETMVGDLRRTFIGWLKKTEGELRHECHVIKDERRALEEEKKRTWEAFLAEKRVEQGKLQVNIIYSNIITDYVLHLTTFFVLYRRSGGALRMKLRYR